MKQQLLHIGNYNSTTFDNVGYTSSQETHRMEIFFCPVWWHRLSVATDCPSQSMPLLKCTFAVLHLKVHYVATL